MFTSHIFSRLSRLISRGALALLAAVLTATVAYAVPADPNAQMTITQPDGVTQITLRPVGDERTGRLVTPDGYTVLRDAEGWYRYATTGADGRTVASDIAVTPADKRGSAAISLLAGIQPMLPLANDRVMPELIKIDRTAQPTALTNRGAETINNVLVILIQFPDEAGVYPTSDFDNLLNQPGYNTYGSMNDYYQEVSYGQFGIVGTTVGWYTASNPRAFYGYNGGNNWTAAAQLTREAVIAARDAGVNFAPFDNDNNGQVDGLFVAHAGPGAETGADGYPWSHKWSLSSAGLLAVSASGKTINSYTMEPEKYSSTSITRIGVFCHEYGHEIGLPDLYDTDGSSIGIGRWCNMAGGTWNGPAGGGGKSPAHFSAWCKKQLGWLTPYNVDTDLYDTTVIDAAGNPVVYRLWTEGQMGSQYFLAEYRRQVGFDTYLPGCGMAVWHIDDTRSGNSDDSHRLVDLEEADNTENNSSGDVWKNKTFSNTSTPNSGSYANAETKVEIQVKSGSCDTGGLVADLYVGLPRCCFGSAGNIDQDPGNTVNLTDLTILVDRLFSSFGDIPCPASANIDGDPGCQVNLTDVTALVNSLFVTFEPTAQCNFNCEQ
jgi:M6 family metalloprotease-like protein